MCQVGLAQRTDLGNRAHQTTWYMCEISRHHANELEMNESAMWFNSSRDWDASVPSRWPRATSHATTCLDHEYSTNYPFLHLAQGMTSRSSDVRHNIQVYSMKS